VRTCFPGSKALDLLLGGLDNLAALGAKAGVYSFRSLSLGGPHEASGAGGTWPRWRRWRWSQAARAVGEYQYGGDLGDHRDGGGPEQFQQRGQDATSAELANSIKTYTGPAPLVAGPLQGGAEKATPNLCAFTIGYEQRLNGQWVSVADGINGKAINTLAP
jgi:hypothetical protein